MASNFSWSNHVRNLYEIVGKCPLFSWTRDPRQNSDLQVGAIPVCIKTRLARPEVHLVRPQRRHDERLRVHQRRRAARHLQEHELQRHFLSHQLREFNSAAGRRGARPRTVAWLARVLGVWVGVKRVPKHGSVSGWLDVPQVPVSQWVILNLISIRPFRMRVRARPGEDQLVSRNERCEPSQSLVTSNVMRIGPQLFGAKILKTK